jgi:hypothetical protein
MKIEDLAVAAENVRKIEQERQNAIAAFVTYSKNYITSKEYENLTQISRLVFESGKGYRFISKGHANFMNFNPLHDSETPFYSLIDGISKWLSWEEVAVDWGVQVTGKASDPALFWSRLTEGVHGEAYMWRRKYDPDFNESERSKAGQNQILLELPLKKPEKSRHRLLICLIFVAALVGFMYTLFRV